MKITVANTVEAVNIVKNDDGTVSIELKGVDAGRAEVKQVAKKPAGGIKLIHSGVRGIPVLSRAQNEKITASKCGVSFMDGKLRQKLIENGGPMLVRVNVSDANMYTSQKRAAKYGIQLRFEATHKIQGDTNARGNVYAELV